MSVSYAYQYGHEWLEVSNGFQSAWTSRRMLFQYDTMFAIIVLDFISLLRYVSR